jgi:hypothetical protein
MMKLLVFAMLIEGTLWGASLHASPKPCIFEAKQIETVEFGTLLVNVDARGRFELIRCEELQIGSRRFAVVLARVQIPNVEVLQSAYGGWRARVRLSHAKWMWLESPQGWICDGSTLYPCSLAVYASDHPDDPGAIFELNIQSPTPILEAVRFEWLLEPVLSEIF